MRLALLAPLVLAACNVAPDPADQAALRAGTDALRATLPQPGSAQFKDTEIHRGSGDTVVCGKVNGSVGLGLTGYERFISGPRIKLIESAVRSAAEMDREWAKWCRD